ncbi:hypothetical protein EK21DRAFT_85594 [Setomelanomma holmii]|uniref:Uncharacterized protein n=1 Tax=Setomelanomma holmii TaxID=210430 RepID=A0A9P4HIE9_9PLEO|nr:hypothetical protein EK21DRAFT_85594 [Setomelanomma holmii]
MSLNPDQAVSLDTSCHGDTGDLQAAQAQNQGWNVLPTNALPPFSPPYFTPATFRLFEGLEELALNPFVCLPSDEFSEHQNDTSSTAQYWDWILETTSSQPWLEPAPLVGHGHPSPFDPPELLEVPRLIPPPANPSVSLWSPHRPSQAYGTPVDGGQEGFYNMASSASFPFLRRGSGAPLRSVDENQNSFVQCAAIALPSVAPSIQSTYAPQPIAFAPRPFHEYQALLSHGEQISHQAAEVRCGKRKLRDDSLNGVAKRSRVSVEADAGHIMTDNGTISMDPRFVPNSNADIPQTFAAGIIGKARDNKRHAHARPWGLQRILTHRFIEKECARLDMPKPPITDADIYLYCYSKNSPWDVIRSVVPPENVDVRLLGNIEISAEEILAFFPHHLKWSDVIYRLVQNGWSPNDMANYINYTRNLSRKDGKRGNTILKWLQAADKIILGKEKSGFRDRASFNTTCSTAKDWVPYEHPNLQGRIDYFLVDLADGLARFPLGDGARLLTRAVRLAVARDDRDVKLSEIHQYIRGNLLIIPPLPSMREQMMAGNHPDAAAIGRWREESPIVRRK